MVEQEVAAHDGQITTILCAIVKRSTVLDIAKGLGCKSQPAIVRFPKRSAGSLKLYHHDGLRMRDASKHHCEPNAEVGIFYLFVFKALFAI